MKTSRTARRRQVHQSRWQSVYAICWTIFFGAGTIALFLYDKFLATLLTVVLFFGILCIQPAYKRFLPGLTCSSAVVRQLAAFFYLLLTIAVISKVKLIVYAS